MIRTRTKLIWEAVFLKLVGSAPVPTAVLSCAELRRVVPEAVATIPHLGQIR